MHEEFTKYKPHAKNAAVIEQANEIIAEYTEQGLTLTLRQLFYQFVARNLLKNAQGEYRMLSGVVTKARDGGLIDWDASLMIADALAIVERRLDSDFAAELAQLERALVRDGVNRDSI
jgi:hypothetical protein